MKSNKNIIAILLLMVALGTALFMTSRRYYDLEKQECFGILQESTAQLADEINSTVANDRHHLKILSKLISHYEAYQATEIKEILTTFDGCNMISRLEVLLPGDQILMSDGRLVNAAGKLSFIEEAAQGEHISGRSYDLLDEEKMIVRNFVPVKKDGEIVALLYGVIELERLQNLYYINAFKGNAQVYLIDGTTGEFLLDTWHGILRNVKNFEKHVVKDGYDENQLFTDLIEGRSGTFVFLSQNAKEYFYSYYMPVGIDRWMLMVSVPESIAFARMEGILGVSYDLVAIEILVLFIYFLWMLVSVRKASSEKENQLSRVQYMFAVEKLLFDAHLKPAHIIKALQKISDVLTAEKTFFCLVDGAKVGQKYIWDGCLLQEAETCGALDLSNVLAYFDEREFCENKSIKFDHLHDLQYRYPKAYEAMTNAGVRNLMLVPILGTNETLVGILGACNMRYSPQDLSQLECVSLSFSMVINNMRIYQTIRKMGMMDSLTGLLNRNSYHVAVAEMKKGEYFTLACIYIDANGLHEINNCLGHEEGDRMLQCVAESIRLAFDEGEAYRIGGDEFVILCGNQSYEDVVQKAEAIKKAVFDSGYCISSGCEWREADLNIDAIIRAAEQKMQQDKRMYYKKKGDLRKIREMNHQLDKMLMEKHDADAFLSVISPNFKGVYFVSLTTDHVRHIYIPEYYEKMLQQADGKFSEAIDLYAKKVVNRDYYQEFQAFCDYGHVEKQLWTKETMEFQYEKVNGVKINLKIFKIKKFTEEYKETLWIFEEAEK